MTLAIAQKNESAALLEHKSSSGRSGEITDLVTSCIPILPDKLIHKIFSYLPLHVLESISRQAYEERGLSGMLHIIGKMGQLTIQSINFNKKSRLPAHLHPNFTLEELCVRGKIAFFQTSAFEQFENLNIDYIQRRTDSDLKKFADHLVRLDIDELKAAFEKALALKAFSVIHLILAKRINDLSDDQIDSCLFLVASLGDSDSLKLILRAHRFYRIPSAQLTKAVQAALKNRHIQIVELFIKNFRVGEIIYYLIDELLPVLCSFERFDLIHDLLANYSFLELSKEKLEAIFLSALNCSDRALGIKSLLKSATMNKKYFFLALVLYAKTGEISLVEALMQETYFSYLSVSEYNDFFRLTLESKQSDVIKLLVKAGHFYLKNAIQNSFAIACENNLLDIVQEVLSIDNGISLWTMVSSLKDSIKNNQMAIVDLIINQPKFLEISEDEIYCVLCEAIEIGNETIVNRLTQAQNFEKLSSMPLGGLVLRACRLSHFNLALILMTKTEGFELSTHELSAALVLGAGKNCLELVNFVITLSKFAEIQEEFLVNAVFKAIENKNLAVINRLLNSHEFDEGYLAFFINESKKRSLGAIETLFKVFLEGSV